MKRTPEVEKEIFTQEAWERSLLHGLACEWENSLWVLSPAHRKMMRPPLFSLVDREDQWGSWSGKKREISLSRKLVLNHPWDAVCEVLLHEMAHQFTEEVFAAHHEPPHGPQAPPDRAARGNTRGSTDAGRATARVLCRF